MKKKLITLLKLCAVTSFALLVANEVIAASAELLDKLDREKQGHKYKWRFGNIFYTKKGTGSPVLLIHDLVPGASGYEWTKIEEKLAETHTVYTVDLLGCGCSDKPAIVYTNFLHVQMLDDFIKNVIKEKPEVIVSGYSASIVSMLTLYNKEAILSITMINPSDLSILSEVPGTKERIIRKLLETPILGTFIYYMVTCRSNLDYSFTEKYYYNPFHVEKKVLDAYYEAAHKGGSNGKYLFASLFSKYMNFNILPALAKMEIPVNIIMGGADPNAEIVAEKYCEFLKNAKITYISSSKCLPHIENPEDFLENIK